MVLLLQFCILHDKCECSSVGISFWFVKAQKTDEDQKLPSYLPIVETSSDPAQIVVTHKWVEASYCFSSFTFNHNYFLLYFVVTVSVGLCNIILAQYVGALQ